MRILPSRYRWLVLVVATFALLLAIGAVQFYQQDSTKGTSEIKREATESSDQSKPEDKPNPTPQPSANPQNGTCTITKNGVTMIVPADEVNIDEKSSGNIDLKVDCKSSSTNSNGASNNNSSIKTNIKVETNTD